VRLCEADLFVLNLEWFHEACRRLGTGVDEDDGRLVATWERPAKRRP
jgi:hypothetical protein